MKKWRRISAGILYAVHDAQLAQHGGIDGISDKNLIASAHARPQRLVAYGNPPPDAVALAAAYACGLVKNRGSSDGNKRTAWIAARPFLLDNGCHLVFTADDAIRAVVDLAGGARSKKSFAAWLRQRMD